MKEELKVIMYSLQVERDTLLQEKRALDEQLRALNKSRSAEIRRALVDLLPDLEKGTVKKIQELLPRFHIPMVSAWFGFSKKVDPNVSCDELRMQLGTYLDNLESAPKFWYEKIGQFDQSIRDLQVNLIKVNAQRMENVSEQIAAIEKLQSIDHQKMKPETKKKIETAIKAQAKNIVSGKKLTGGSFNRRSYSSAPIYPNTSQTTSDSGVSLLEMWLWYEILTPDSECSHEVQRIEAGGGEFGGGGASGDFSDNGVQTSHEDGNQSAVDQSDFASAAVTGGAIASEMGNIESHYDLGAGNFS